MKPHIYQNLVYFVLGFDGSDHECLKQLSKMYPQFSNETLGSIINRQKAKQSKLNHWRCKNDAKQLYEKFLATKVKDASSSNYSLITLSKKYNVPPLTMARIVLSQCFDNPIVVQNALKDTTLIQNSHLANAVFMCTLYDSSSSSLGMLIKKRVGYEYEMKLINILKEHNLSFRNENELRLQSFIKTPDILLDVPVLISNSIVKWIESKALFADKQTHEQYCQEQYLTYYKLFGPGLVIYWFGYVDDIIAPDEHRYIINSTFPTDFLRL